MEGDWNCCQLHLIFFASTECYLHLASEIWFIYSYCKCFALLYSQSSSCWYQFHRCLCIYSPKPHTHSFIQQDTLAFQWFPTLIHNPQQAPQFQETSSRHHWSPLGTKTFMPLARSIHCAGCFCQHAAYLFFAADKISNNAWYAHHWFWSHRMYIRQNITDDMACRAVNKKSGQDFVRNCQQKHCTVVSAVWFYLFFFHMVKMRAFWHPPISLSFCMEKVITKRTISFLDTISDHYHHFAITFKKLFTASD